MVEESYLKKTTSLKGRMGRGEDFILLPMAPSLFSLLSPESVPVPSMSGWLKKNELNHMV